MGSKAWRFGFLGAAIAALLGGCFLLPVDGSLVITFAGGLPDGVTGINYTIVGSDFDDMTGTISADSEDVITVPPGTDREYTVVVDVDNDSPVTQYTATGTFDVVAGEPAEVTAHLFVSGSALIIPDRAFGRLVQIDAVDYTSWAEQDRFFYVMDAEIGPDGLIYVLYNFDGWVVEKLDSIDDATSDGIIDFLPYDEAGTSLAIDHPNRVLYYASETTVYSVPLGGETVTTHTPDLQIATGPGISGLATDNSGTLYIAYSPDSDGTQMSVAEFVPDSAGGAGTIVDTHTVTTNGQGYYDWDVLWKDGELVVAYNWARTIVNLTTGEELGNLPDGEPQTGEFVGPARFVGHGNPFFAVVDDDRNGLYDQVVSFDDLTGAGWRTAEPSGEQTQFGFFREPL